MKRRELAKLEELISDRNEAVGGLKAFESSENWGVEKVGEFKALEG